MSWASRLGERSSAGVLALVLAGGAGSAVAAASVSSAEALDRSIISRDVMAGSHLAGDRHGA
jgi:hypothetical protein